MTDRIEVYCDSQGVWYTSTKLRFRGEHIGHLPSFP